MFGRETFFSGIRRKRVQESKFDIFIHEGFNLPDQSSRSKSEKDVARIEGT